MTPPEKLRRELERQRDRGHSFRVAWPSAMSCALAGLGRSESIFWRRTFSEQRAVWAVSYSRAPWPANDLPRLSPVDHEHRERARGRLVA